MAIPSILQGFFFFMIKESPRFEKNKKFNLKKMTIRYICFFEKDFDKTLEIFHDIAKINKKKDLTESEIKNLKNYILSLKKKEDRLYNY
jgi:hypothetical protein